MTATEATPTLTAPSPVFAPTSEQAELRDAARRFLANHCDQAAVRQWMDTDVGYDRRLWQRMATEMGIAGLAVSDAYGGAGAGLAELAVVAEELGRALYGGPFLSTAVLAVATLTHAADEASAGAYLRRIAAGELTAALAVVEDETLEWPTGPQTTGSLSSGGWQVSGTKKYVVDGGSADILLVTASVDGDPALLAVDGAATGVTREPLTTMDQTRKLAVAGFNAAPAQLLGRGTSVSLGLETVLTHARITLAAECVGCAEHCLSDAVEYAKTRIQFGRPIGSFQAVKHRCADMLASLESARSAATYSAWCADHWRADLPIASALAHAYCPETYRRLAEANIATHGGIGFTWEHSAHLYLKRAKSSEMLLGSALAARRQLADALGLAGTES